MEKLIKKIDEHILEAGYSAWSGMAKIKVDGQERFSKFVFYSATETVTVSDRKFKVKFSGLIFPKVEITEI